MSTNNKSLIKNFIEQIWNKRMFDKLDDFLHSDYRDYSLPAMLSPDKDGLLKWILATSSSFEHATKIEDQVSEGDKIIVKIQMKLKHTGVWHNIEASGKEVTAKGYRYFKLKESKIIEHWALIDGQSIERQLKEATNTCKPAL